MQVLHSSLYLQKVRPIWVFYPAEMLLVGFVAQKLLITLFLSITNVLQHARGVEYGEPSSDHTRKQISVNSKHSPLHSSQPSQLHKVHH